MFILGTAAALPETGYDVANLSSSNFSLGVSGLPAHIQKNPGTAENIRYEKINTITIDENTKLTTTRVYVNFPIVFWTEIQPSVAVTANSQQIEREWLNLITTEDSFWKTNYLVTPYRAKFENYLNPIVTNIGKGFSGDINLIAECKSLVPSSLNFGTVDYQITCTEFTSSLNQITVLSSNVVDVASYKTNVYAAGETTLTARDVSIADGKSAAKAAANEAGDILMSHLDNAGVGFKRMSVYNTWLQQRITSPPPVGGSAKNGLHLAIGPDIQLIKEPMLVTYKQVAVDTKSGAVVSKAGLISEWTTPATTTTFDRVIGWKIQNYAVRVNLLIEFNLYSKYVIKRVAEPAKPTVQIPNVQFGDITIESLISGDTGSQLDFQSKSDWETWWSNLWADYWYVILAIGAVVVVGVGIAIFYYANAASGGALGVATKNAIRTRLNKKKATEGNGDVKTTND